MLIICLTVRLVDVSLSQQASLYELQRLPDPTGVLFLVLGVAVMQLLPLSLNKPLLRGKWKTQISQ